MSKMGRRAAQVVRALPRSAAAHLLFLFSRRSSLGRISLVDASRTSSRDADKKLDEALLLIATTLPAVHRRLQRDVRRVVLLEAGGPEYWPFVNAIVLTKSVVQGAEVALLAMLLVHEGVHARLWHMGIGYPRQLRARIEQLCVVEEVRLARGLPNAEELIAFAEEKLKNEWWSDDAVGRRIDRARVALRET